MKNPFVWIIGIVVAIAFILAVVPFTMVSSGEEAIIFRTGQINRVVGAGIHYKTPFIETVDKYDTTVQKEQIDAAAASKDLQTVSTSIAVNYRIDETKLKEIYLDNRGEYKVKLIDPAVQEAVKAATAKYTAEELVTKREEVKEVITQNLKEALTSRYIIVSNVSITNFEFSQSFNAAIEAKVKAEQDALAAKNKLEQIKYEAEQTVTTAKATAEAQRISSQALAAQGGADYVNLKAIEKWDGHLPNQMIPGQSLPFVNLSK